MVLSKWKIRLGVLYYPKVFDYLVNVSILQVKNRTPSFKIGYCPAIVMKPLGYLFARSLEKYNINFCRAFWRVYPKR